tara:strand:- start:359 stop:517 length:159 start_codon:yes stop_codon:yes gene_type:complete
VPRAIEASFTVVPSAAKEAMVKATAPAAGLGPRFVRHVIEVAVEVRVVMGGK